MSDQNTYYPPPESQGGWRYLATPEEQRRLGGLDPVQLDRVLEQQRLFYNDSYAIVIVRHGYLVREEYTFNVLVPTRFDIWSCTKTLTGTAWGLLFEDFRQGRLQAAKGAFDLDSLAYDYLPEGWPLSDPRKARITFRHLLSMTSGIPGEMAGILGMPTATGVGQFEHALGRAPNRYGRWASQLLGEPGEVFDYSDPAFAHLSLAFYNITGRELDDYLHARLFQPIGIENLSWDVQGGSGFLGPHTNPHTGVHVSARELARFGYLVLQHGQWNGQAILPRWWQDLATRPSQNLEPNYGLTWWLNASGAHWPGLPRDMIALMGFRSNRCYVVPSLDLVVVRLGSGPASWSEPDLIGGILQSIL
jgi:CubicO group peptidase (beta-lactamase class C family)